MENQTKHLLKFLILPLLVAFLLVIYYGKQEEQDGFLKVKFYNVGQGDSFFIRTPEGNQVLVDGGPGDSVIQKLGSDMGVFDKTIEMVILTHAHLDHFEGLISVFNKYNVEKILLPNTDVKSAPYVAFTDAVEKEGAEVVYAVQGQRIFLDSITVLDILNPASRGEIKLGKNGDINDTSIVAILRFGKTEMLLTGDAGTNIEDMLLGNFDLDVDVLKVGHHGSKHSTSEKFLQATSPQYSVIQFGDGNKYGHPAPEIVDRLKSLQVDMSQTNQNDVEFVSDGLSFKRN